MPASMFPMSPPCFAKCDDYHLLLPVATLTRKRPRTGGKSGGAALITTIFISSILAQVSGLVVAPFLRYQRLVHEIPMSTQTIRPVADLALRETRAGAIFLSSTSREHGTWRGVPDGSTAPKMSTQHPVWANSSGALRQFRERAGLKAFLAAVAVAFVVFPLKTLAATTSAAAFSAAAILQSELLFVCGTALFLAAAVQRYKGYLAWSLPAPPREGVDIWISTVVGGGLLFPLCVLAVGVALNIAPALLLAAFGPYFAIILVQLVAWRVVGFKQSAAWPLVAIPFTLWRIHQAARAGSLLAAAGAPVFISACFSFVLVPFWSLDLFLHLLLWPIMYRWPIRDNSLVTAVGPPKKTVDSEEQEGWRVLEEIEALKVQRARLEQRARLLQSMQSNTDSDAKVDAESPSKRDE